MSQKVVAKRILEQRLLLRFVRTPLVAECGMRRKVVVCCLLVVCIGGTECFTVQPGNEPQNSVADQSSSYYSGKADFNALYEESTDGTGTVDQVSRRTPSSHNVLVEQHFDSPQISIFGAWLGLPDTNFKYRAFVACAEDAEPRKEPTAVTPCNGSLAHSKKVCFPRVTYAKCNIDLFDNSRFPRYTSKDVEIRRAPANRIDIWERNVTVICDNFERATKSPPILFQRFGRSIQYSFLCLRESNLLMMVGCEMGSVWDFLDGQCVRQEAFKAPPSAKEGGRKIITQKG